MKLYDIYKHKKTSQLIQIEMFASEMLDWCKEYKVVFSRLDNHGNGEIGSCPSFAGYGTTEQIEAEYELFISQEDLKNYSDWEEIFELAIKD